MDRSSRHPREVRECAVALVWESQSYYGSLGTQPGPRPFTMRDCTHDLCGYEAFSRRLVSCQ